jgi:large subunit ribosomal protein L21
MFAVIKTGGKQYRVAAEDQITVMTVAGAAGEIVTFSDVLMLVDGEAATFGAPFVAGASVAAEILSHGRGPKAISFKKRRRQNSKRKRGHRQDLTLVRITEILTGGAKASAKQAAPVAAVAAGAISDDVELIGGIGPTIGKKLKAAGVTTWRQVAAWTEADIAKFDAELNLRGRIQREEWVEQAKELVDGKPPRAKVDQERAAKGE